MNSGVTNDSMVYFAVRRLTESNDNSNWYWYWLTYDADAPGYPVKLKLSEQRAQFNGKTIVPPSNALFRVKLESGPFIINPADKSKSPDTYWDESTMGVLQLEKQLRFTLQTPHKNDITHSGGKLVVANGKTAQPVIWKLNWFSTQTWEGIVDFGMSFTNNITTSDFTGQPNGRSAYPQSVWSGVDETMVQVQPPMYFVNIANDDGLVRLSDPRDVSTQRDLGTLNFRMLLESCVTSSPRECTFTSVPGRGRRKFYEGDLDPNIPKGEMACSPNMSHKCTSQAMLAVEACAASTAILAIASPSLAKKAGLLCVQKALAQVMKGECTKCACQAMGCPAFSECAESCGGEVAAPLQCHKDSDCMYTNIDSKRKCVVNDPDNINKPWHTDYCQVTEHEDRCSCANPDPDTPEFQCMSDDQCTSTRSLKDNEHMGFDEGLTKYAKSSLVSSVNCDMQRWHNDDIIKNFFYGGPVCKNPNLSPSLTCQQDGDCQTPADGAGMKGDARKTKIGRGCKVFYPNSDGNYDKGDAYTKCIENVPEKKAGDPCMRTANEEGISGVCGPDMACGFETKDKFAKNEPTCCPTGRTKHFYWKGGSNSSYDDGYLCVDLPLGGTCSRKEQCAGAGVDCQDGKCVKSCGAAPYDRSWPDCDVNSLDPATDPFKAIPECGSANAEKSYCCFASKVKADQGSNCPAGYSDQGACTQEFKVWEKDWMHHKCLKD